jgi:hypothetical protein
MSAKPPSGVGGLLTLKPHLQQPTLKLNLIQKTIKQKKL